MSSLEDIQKMDAEMKQVDLGDEEEEDPRKARKGSGDDDAAKEALEGVSISEALTEPSESPLMSAREALRDLWTYTEAHQGEDELLKRSTRSLWMKPLFGNSKSEEQKRVEQARKELTEQQFNQAEEYLDDLLEHVDELQKAQKAIDEAGSSGAGGSGGDEPQKY